MKKNMLFFLFLSLMILSCSGQKEKEGSQTGDLKELTIPPLLPYTEVNGEKVFEFNARESRHVFSPDITSTTMAYGGSTYLGPTIRVKRGDKVRFRVKNDLSTGTTVHWHGLKVPSEMDGNMHQPIAPGETWDANYTIGQPAGTFWYHPHFQRDTGYQVYKGLAGYYFIDDDIEAALPLPRDYGVDDIPLIIQDRNFDASGEILYSLSPHTENQGVLGETILVNGVEQPRYTIKNRLTRFRLLNGSNSSIYTFRLSNGLPMAVIAGDGGLLSAPVNRKTITLSPGERVEFLVDFGDLNMGSRFSLELATQYGLNTQAMTFRIESLKERGTSLPPRLAEVEKLIPPDDALTRRFVFETASTTEGEIMGGMMNSMMGQGRLTINGKNLDMERIDERVPVGKIEIWEISSPGKGMMGFLPHNFHVHGTSFQILSINGVSPAPELAGWKDTVLLTAGTTIRIAIQFEEYKGLYMYHCHLLEHEDFGMMGQLEVF